MIISESKSYDVTLKVVKDATGCNVYMITYGLQVKTYDDYDDAMTEYVNCMCHAIECEGILGEYL